MSSALALALLSGTAAACFDLRSRRIPNWLTFGSLLMGVALNSWQSGWAGTQAAVVGAALGFGLLLPFYALRAVGAGDVKLLAALGALVGAQVLVSVAVYGALAGGLMSLVLLAGRGDLLGSVQRSLGSLALPLGSLALPLGSLGLPRLGLPRRSGLKAPYGLAIASGVYLSCILPGVLG